MPDATPPMLLPLAAWHYQQLQPIATDDHLYGWALAHYCAALWAPIEGIVALFSDQPDGTPGWAACLQVETCPSFLLPWLGQHVGVRWPAGTSDATARLMISETRGFNRGTPDAMFADIKATLTGTQSLRLQERDTGPHHLTFYTKAAETPDPPGTLAAANAADRKRVGLQVAHVISDSPYIDDMTRVINAITVAIDAMTNPADVT